MHTSSGKEETSQERGWGEAGRWGGREKERETETETDRPKIHPFPFL
jgi:hypothetical protein